MGKQEVGHYQYYPFMNLGHFRLYDLVKPRMKKQLAAFYRQGIELAVKQGRDNPYRIGVPFIWCSNNLTVALATQAALYERMTEVNFSHQVLAHRPEQLAVLKVTGIRWNDLGEPKRVMASLRMAGVRPHWAQGGMPQLA